MQVTPHKIECKSSDLELVLLPRLRGRVFHVSEPASFDRITRSARISSNQQANFTWAFGDSQNSYGRKRGWVSLFDLRSATDAYVKEALISYYLLKVFHSKNPRICLLFITPDAWPSLISWQDVKQDMGQKEVIIPFVEAWYPGDIPLHLVNDCLLVTLQYT